MSTATAMSTMPMMSPNPRAWTSLCETLRAMRFSLSTSFHKFNPRLNLELGTLNPRLPEHGQKFRLANQKAPGPGAGVAGRARDGAGGRDRTSHGSQVRPFLGAGRQEFCAQPLSGAGLGAGLYNLARTDPAAGCRVGC